MPNNSSPKDSLSYADSGVDIDAGNALVENIKRVTARTTRPEVLSRLGGFNALCELPGRYRQPVLVSATDGVGTKLKLAMALGIHDSIGIDLVAMCVNDLIVCGAEPLFFLDYYATGKLDVAVATDVVSGIGAGCEQAGCALIGGETAEMPGMYQGGDYDLAGFAVGVVEKSAIIETARVQPGDVLIGLASSGPHANGYSLIRHIIELRRAKLDDPFGAGTLGGTLLTPTRIYVTAIAALKESISVHGICHITGGGLVENIPRMLPENCAAKIRVDSWRRPPIFQWLQEQGKVGEQEMLRTFNCGIGMVVCVAGEDFAAAVDRLQKAGETALRIGEIVDRQAGRPAVITT